MNLPRKIPAKARIRKYTPEKLIAALRLAARLRSRMRKMGLTDNGGAIHSAERIVNLLGLALCYPDISHINHLERSEFAKFSVKALRGKKEKPLIEHIAPLRALTQRVLERVDRGDGDKQIESYLKRMYRLALLTPHEASQLNKSNRSKIDRRRLEKVKIKLVARP